ncbi:hypothetical protein [Modestobacter italicus]|uniref:hypothetical protein n=1 Tax=Modestobacter italicus (strain DSM 44449 / CECT 9708 / BC 501) TaxID=2732864 RepID=UPI001C964F91|nr:hypothetical protein [Modestobacter italicus]
MNSTDMTVAGVSTVTSPAVGLRCSVPADRVALMAPYAAPWNGTGLSNAGSDATARLRGLIAAAGTTGSLTTGAPIGTDAQPSDQTTALTGAFAGVPARHTSSTPGDLPPEDPLS